MESIEHRPARRPRARRGSRRSGCSQRAKLEILGAVLLGMFLAALDQTIVGPVLPKIIGELNGSDYYTWAVTIYLLTSTVTVPIYGKLSDLYGRKPIFMGGIGAVPRRLGAVRPEPGDVAARAVPRHPGPRRGRALPDRARGHRRPVHARQSAASTRASSASCSASRSSSGRSSAAS